MTYDPDRHHRRSIRMPDHDYGGGGAYFLTLCVDGGALLFGEIDGSTMHASEAGSMVERTWYEAADVCVATSSVAFQLMPNHIHGLLVIASGGSMRPTSLPEFVRRFKTITGRRYADGVQSHSWPRFDGRLWQRGYHEHLIRNDRARDRVVRYIEANPARWIHDRENPSAVRAVDAQHGRHDAVAGDDRSRTARAGTEARPYRDLSSNTKAVVKAHSHATRSPSIRPS